MGGKLKSGRAAFWRKLIERRRRSGLSVERCCAEAGVSPASFYQWQRKFRSEGVAGREAAAGRPASSRLVPVRLVDDDAIRFGGASDVLEVELPGEIRLRIPAGYDAATLRRVVSVLCDESMPAVAANRPAEIDELLPDRWLTAHRLERRGVRRRRSQRPLGRPSADFRRP